MYLAIGFGIIILMLVVTGYFTYIAFKDNYAIKYFSLFMFIFILFLSLYMLFRLIKASM